jgi:hypothetical protein
MESVGTSEMSVYFYESTGYHIPEGCHLVILCSVCKETSFLQIMVLFVITASKCVFTMRCPNSVSPLTQLSITAVL